MKQEKERCCDNTCFEKLQESEARIHGQLLSLYFSIDPPFIIGFSNISNDILYATCKS